jgi:hypothetical protein
VARLADAERRGVYVLEIRAGEPLGTLARASYDAGWVLREVDDSGATVAVYQRDPRERVRR